MKKAIRRRLVYAAVAVSLLITILGTALTMALRRMGPQLASFSAEIIRSSTGLNVEFSNVALKFGVNPAVQFYGGRLVEGTNEVLRFNYLAIFYSYRSILHGKFLPVKSVIIDQPRWQLSANVFPSGSSGQSITSLSARDYLSLVQDRVVRVVEDKLRLLAKFAGELSITEGLIFEPDGQSVVSNLSLWLSSSGGRLWQARFAAVWMAQPMPGLRIDGDCAVNLDGNATTSKVQLKLNFWQSKKQLVELEGLKLEAAPRGSLQVELTDLGMVHGSVTLELRNAQLTTPFLSASSVASSCLTSATLNLGPDWFRLNQLILTCNKRALFEGSVELTGLASKPSNLTVHAKGPTLSITEIRQWINLITNPPSLLKVALGDIQSGTLNLEKFDFQTEITPQLHFTWQTLFRNSGFVLHIDNLSTSALQKYQLTEVSNMSGILRSDRGQFTLSDVKARMGRSHLDDARLEFSARSLSTPIVFSFWGKGLFALEELVEPAESFLGTKTLRLRQYIDRAEGTIEGEVRLRGTLDNLYTLAVKRYLVDVRPKSVVIRFTHPRKVVQISDGSISVVPGLLTASQLSISEGAGKAFINGSAKLFGRNIELRRIDVEVEHFAIDDWLSPFLKPETATARGFLTGRITFVGLPGLGRQYSAFGSLTLSPCIVKLKILRAPVEARSATLTAYGSSAELAFSEVFYENSPAALKISLPDITKPLANMKISVSRLDLRSLKFIRFPGQPKPPPPHFSPDTKIVGHVSIDTVYLDGFIFDNVELDFERHGQNWHIYNVNGEGYGGKFNLDVTGRSEDDILHILLKVNKLDIAWFLAAIDQKSKPVLSGRLNLDADLVGDTNDNFRETVSGRASFDDRNGTVYRLVLLSRVMSLLSVSGVLRGRLPDPFIEGVPFRVLKGNFKIKDGVMHTEDLLLDGPIMRMSAIGYVFLPSDTIDLTVGVMPFNMLDKLLNMLPVVGSGLAKQDSLLALYFNARGRLSNPVVTPAPITSVTNILKKLLTLPVNIINSGLQQK